jgi:HrpA-like RNA helicase
MYKLYKYMSDPAFIHRQYIIKNLMINNNVLILTSGTGLGKTTKVPLFMIELFTKKGY